MMYIIISIFRHFVFGELKNDKYPQIVKKPW